MFWDGKGAHYSSRANRGKGVEYEHVGIEECGLPGAYMFGTFITLFHSARSRREEHAPPSIVVGLLLLGPGAAKNDRSE